MYFDDVERREIMNNRDFAKGLFKQLAEIFEEKVLLKIRDTD